MRRVLISVAIALCCQALASAADRIEVPRELWDRPRTGRAILEQQSVRQAVTSALARPQSQIVIHHAAGQEPLLQAEELRSWLGALAIDTRRIALRSDGASDASLTIEVDP